MVRLWVAKHCFHDLYKCFHDYQVMNCKVESFLSKFEVFLLKEWVNDFNGHAANLSHKHIKHSGTCLKKTFHSHVVKIFNFSDVSVKSGTVQYGIYCTFREANIDSSTTSLESRFVFWILPRIFLSRTALELYVRQNLVKGLGLRLQWYHLPLAEIWYFWMKLTL